jgi:hypothetical protein
MTLKKILLAVTLAASFTTAYAGTINGVTTPDITLAAHSPNPLKYSAHFGNDPVGVFSDVFTFTPAITSGSKVSGAFVNMDLDGGGVINFGGATLNGVAFTQTGVDRWSLASTLIPPGILTLTIWGTVTDGGSYGGNLNVLMAAPVPEPETYAMLLGGLALMGVVARRRKQA